MTYDAKCPILIRSLSSSAKRMVKTMEKQIIESVLKSLLKRGLITSSEKERIIKKVSE